MAHACGCIGGPITAAFKSVHDNEVYIFLKNKTYVVDKYDPSPSCPKKDKILCGPTPISQGFPSLKDTIFDRHGIDCAFATGECGKVYIFSGPYCALFDYGALCSRVDKIIKGPMCITEMFPFLKGTSFETGIEAAIDVGSIKNQAYIFKGDQYARIDFGPNPKIVFKGISDNWDLLKGTILQSSIDAAFASHNTNEAYFFKGDNFVHAKYTPGSREVKFLGASRVMKIKDYWPELAKNLPKTN